MAIKPAGPMDAGEFGTLSIQVGVAVPTRDVQSYRPKMIQVVKLVDTLAYSKHYVKEFARQNAQLQLSAVRATWTPEPVVISVSEE